MGGGVRLAHQVDSVGSYGSSHKIRGLYSTSKFYDFFSVGTLTKIPLYLGNPNPRKLQDNTSFHLIVHFITFHFIDSP